MQAEAGDVMRLTSYSNYSLRVLLAAAARSPRLTPIREVAEAFDLPQSHLVKCVHQLGTWGYLETVRGNRGGFLREAIRVVDNILSAGIVARTDGRHPDARTHPRDRLGADDDRPRRRFGGARPRRTGRAAGGGPSRHARAA